MDHVQGLSPIVGATRVHERNGGSKRDAAAFRRAMQDQTGQEAGAEAGGGDAEQPMRTALQRQLANGRKDTGANHRHVDVIA
jgi:hypothetical protein